MDGAEAELMLASGKGLLEVLDEDAELVVQCKRVVGAKQLELKDTFANTRWVVGPLAVQSDVPLFLEVDQTVFEYKGNREVQGEIECEVPSVDLVPPVENAIVNLVKACSGETPEPAKGKRTRYTLFKAEIDGKEKRKAKM